MRRERWRRATVVTVGTTVVVVLAATTAAYAPVHRMESPPVPQPATVAAGLVELPPQTAPAPAPPSPRQAVPPEPPAPPFESLRQAPAVPKPKEPKPHPPTPVTERTKTPSSQTPSPAPPENTPPAQAESHRNDGLPGGTAAARAIVQPSPVIPPELRRHLLVVEAVVRFTIAADGNVTADLEEATPDPQINQILLDTFRRWRFFPAMQEGRPITSTLTLRVPIRVE